MSPVEASNPFFTVAPLPKLCLLARVLTVAIRMTDFTVLEGHRSVEKQHDLYTQGRELRNGVWIKSGKTVTNIDGVTKMGMHNYSPSRAVDLAPWPIDWEDHNRFHFMAGVILTVAIDLGIHIEWGGFWAKLVDMPHFQID